MIRELSHSAHFSIHSKLAKACIAGLLGLALTGCANAWLFPGVFRLDIGQGNIIEQEKLDKLNVGMTKAQVLYVMGSPAIEDPFSESRWDYIFHLRMGSGELSRAQVVLYFEGDRLKEIETRDAEGIQAAQS